MFDIDDCDGCWTVISCASYYAEVTISFRGIYSKGWTLFAQPYISVETAMDR
jgi:hypothetical protein